MFKRGEFQESYNMALKSIELFPDHEDSKELLKNLRKHFSIMWNQNKYKLIINTVKKL